MALLIVNLDTQIGKPQEWIDTVAQQLPGMAVRLWPDAGDPADIEYLAFVRPDFGVLPPLPNLKAMFSRSAGVDGDGEAAIRDFVRTSPCIDAANSSVLDFPALDILGQARVNDTGKADIGVGAPTHADRRGTDPLVRTRSS